MATGRPRTFALGLAALCLAPVGCAGPGPIASRQTMVGSLKASVSQLEFQNEKLKKEVGELKADNSRIDNLLVQEREANGEVTARLDDAKDLIRRGGNAQAMGTSASPLDDDNIPPPVTVPRARRTRSSRSSPTVTIPAPSSNRDDDLSYDPPPRRRARDLGPDDREQDDRWLPVARGLPSTVRQ